MCACLAAASVPNALKIDAFESLFLRIRRRVEEREIWAGQTNPKISDNVSIEKDQPGH